MAMASRAFRRVGAGSQFVEEDQGIPVCLFQKTDYISHVGGKGTERLLNALLISDVSINLFKHAETGVVKSGNMKP